MQGRDLEDWLCNPRQTKEYIGMLFGNVNVIAETSALCNQVHSWQEKHSHVVVL